MDDGDHSVTRLVDAAVRGDERAWHEIVDRYTPLLTGVIRRYRVTTAEAQDVAQTVWLRLVEHLGSLREPRALPMWMITTAKRECMHCVSGQRRLVPLDPQDPSWLATPDEADPEEGLLRAERHEALLAGLAELPARHRELLLLLMVDPPLSYEAISQRTGIAPGGIGPTRSRALERLRQTDAVTQYLDDLASKPPAPGRETDRATER